MSVPSTSRDAAALRGMRTFLIVWLGQLISLIGSGLTSFALGVWMFEETGLATPFALTVLFGSLPRILLAPLAGSLADRWNRRWQMVLGDSGDALVTLGAVVLVALGRLEVWHVYVIAALSASFAAFQDPAYTASVAMLVPKKDLARANGLVQMARSMEMLIAPLLAGSLLGLVGLRGVIAIDFASYFFAIGTLLWVKIPQPELADEDKGRRGGVVWRDIALGWRYVAARPGLLGLLFYFALVNFLINFSNVLMGPLVLSFGTPAALGIVQTAAGVGMLAGSVAISAWGGLERRVMGVVGFIALSAVGIVLMGVQPATAGVAAGSALFLFCIPLASGHSQAIWQTKVAPDVQGRVFAARSIISSSMMPLAFLLAGPLADHVFEPWMAAGGALAQSVAGRLLGTGEGRGIGLIYVISGLLLVFVSALVWIWPQIRRVEDVLPDAVIDPAP